MLSNTNISLSNVNISSVELIFGKFINMGSNYPLITIPVGNEPFLYETASCRRPGAYGIRNETWG